MDDDRRQRQGHSFDCFATAAGKYDIIRSVNQKTKFYLLLFGTCLGLALLVLGASLLLRRCDFGKDFAGTRRAKVYSRTLAEGMHVSRHGYYGIDFLRCGSCRLEKRKRGPLTFGGLNVLEIDDLHVVLPTKGEVSNEADAPDDRSGPRAMARRLGVSDGFLASRGIPLKFSGLHIRTLSVNRLSDDGKSTDRVFVAQSAEAVIGGLSLSGCTVFNASGDGEYVGDAMLSKSGGDLCIAWDGGEMKF